MSTLLLFQVTLQGMPCSAPRRKAPVLSIGIICAFLQFSQDCYGCRPRSPFLYSAQETRMGLKINRWAGACEDQPAATSLEAEDENYG
ncbi:MAG: hypothetical protein EA339_06220 [Rhodobacteraceae bacterium]|nr:MAG: hypothetical protein EA339_06220 [Paracoccaceae bacterium]